MVALRIRCPTSVDASKLSLETFILHIHHSEASESRDRIFALLGLAKSYERDGIPVDWSCPIEALKSRVVEKCYGQDS